MARIRSLTYVRASDMFEGCPTIYNMFNECDHTNVSWGDAAHTLISLREFLSMVELDADEDGNDIPPEEVKIFRKRAADLKLDDPLIDLEN